MVGIARGHQRADTLKPYSQKISQSNHTRTTALSNSMKLSHACGATQDRWVMVERSDRMWSTGKEGRIPGTGEPGGLPSMGSHRVRHDWSDLAAAAACLCLLSTFCLWVWRRGGSSNGNGGHPEQRGIPFQSAVRFPPNMLGKHTNEKIRGILHLKDYKFATSR